MNEPKVYLAGGFHTGWDDEAEQLLPSWECIKPKTHGLKDANLYTPMDMGLIENSTAVLAKFEYFDGVTFANLAFEIGYARRAGKFIVVVMDLEVTEHFKERYFGMPMSAADGTFTYVEDACLFLNDQYFKQPELIVVPPRATKPTVFGPKPQPIDIMPAADGPLHGRDAFMQGPKTQTIPVIEGWIVDFINDVPKDFEPDAVVHGSDETGLPDMIWGRDESYEGALKTAVVIALDEGVFFDDATAQKLLDTARDLDSVPYQTPGYRYTVIRRVGV